MQVLKGLASLGIGLKIIQSDLLVEFAAEFDVYCNPLRVVAGGFRIIVRVL